MNIQGVGLGLSICNEIILAQGGSIDVQSEVGIGTSFIITMKAKCRVDKQRLIRAQQRMGQDGEYKSSSSSEESDGFFDDLG